MKELKSSRKRHAIGTARSGKVGVGGHAWPQIECRQVLVADSKALAVFGLDSEYLRQRGGKVNTFYVYIYTFVDLFARNASQGST